MIQITQQDGSKLWVRTKLDLAYVIQGDDEAGLIKIGRTSNPEQRVSTIVTGVPFKARLVAIMFDGSRRERELKSKLSEFKVQGEWFKPNAVLQQYLRDAFAENAVVSRQRINEAHFEEQIRPVILDYLSGREPKANYAGDLVYRVLREGFSVVQGRTDELLTALAGVVTPEVLAGYVPLAFPAECPQITMPAGALA